MPPNLAQAVNIIAQAVAERFCDKTVAPGVIGQIAEETYKLMQTAPIRRFEVKRQTPNGVVLQQISLPDALAEVADQLHFSNAIALQQFEATQRLIAVIEKNTKVGVKLLKQNAVEDDE